LYFDLSSERVIEVFNAVLSEIPDYVLWWTWIVTIVMINLHHRTQLIHSGIPCLTMLLEWFFLNNISHKIDSRRGGIYPEETLSLSDIQIQLIKPFEIRYAESSLDRHLNSSLNLKKFGVVVVWVYGLTYNRTQLTDSIFMHWKQLYAKWSPVSLSFTYFGGYPRRCLPVPGEARMAIYLTFSSMTEYIIFFAKIREILFLGLVEI
jgi:hypothetical protein